MFLVPFNNNERRPRRELCTLDKKLGFLAKALSVLGEEKEFQIDEEVERVFFFLSK